MDFIINVIPFWIIGMIAGAFGFFWGNRFKIPKKDDICLIMICIIIWIIIMSLIPLLTYTNKCAVILIS